MPSNISKAFVSAKIFWSLSLHKSDLMDIYSLNRKFYYIRENYKSRYIDMLLEIFILTISTIVKK